MSKPIEVFSHEIRVGWAHCDPAMIAYTGNIPGFALEAIDAWWEATIGDNWFAMNVDRNFGTPFVHMSLDFRAPITPRHILLCEVVLVRLGNTSIRFKVVGRQADNVCFEGEFVSVMVEASSMKSQRPPVHVLEKIKSMAIES